MDKETRLFLDELHSLEKWRLFESNYLVKDPPQIPPYKPGDDTHKWAYESGRKDGYDLALSLLGVTNER